MSYFFAFDFDGVLCDSARETGTAGLTALMALTGVTVRLLVHVSVQISQTCTVDQA